MPDAVDLIRAKRDGQEIADADIRWLIDAYTRGVVADEQMSAMAMAVFFRGLAPAELRAWTDAMIASGQRLDLERRAGPDGRQALHRRGRRQGVADPGSAGGQLRCRRARSSPVAGSATPGGRSTSWRPYPAGGPGCRRANLLQLLSTVGCVICAAGADLAPADRKLYALRDVTGTVESIPLIASSIMSKKIAEGTQSLVLDVKVGRGAFMRELDAARELAQTMVRLGTESGVRTVALLTAMDVPLGRAVGNAVEVAESVAGAARRGPRMTWSR